MFTSNSPRRVELTHMPIRVLPILLLAMKTQLDSSLGLKPSLVARTMPGLVKSEVIIRPRKGECCVISLRPALALVDDISVEEVRELGRLRAADGLVVENGVVEGEVDIAPGVLVRGGGEDIRGVEVEVFDCPVLEVRGVLAAAGVVGCCCGSG